VLEDGRYVLQLRDDKPDIWYPGHWGCFGGGADPAEDPVATLRRELREELALAIEQPQFFMRLDFDLRPTGLGTCWRNYFVARITDAALAGCSLGEGAAVGAHAVEALSRLRLVPYDAFALFLHSQRERISR